MPLRALVPVPGGPGEPDQSRLTPLEPVGSLMKETQDKSVLSSPNCFLFQLFSSAVQLSGWLSI